MSRKWITIREWHYLMALLTVGVVSFIAAEFFHGDYDVVVAGLIILVVMVSISAVFVLRDKEIRAKNDNRKLSSIF